jgi:hypothetical protein
VTINQAIDFANGDAREIQRSGPRIPSAISLAGTPACSSAWARFVEE